MYTLFRDIKNVPDELLPTTVGHGGGVSGRVGGGLSADVAKGAYIKE